MSKAKKAQGKLDEVGRDIEKIRQDQTTDDGRILTINGKVDEQNSNNNKNWQDVLDMIAQEGDLFAKISKKLKDDELRKVCACCCVHVFECVTREPNRAKLKQTLRYQGDHELTKGINTGC